MWAIADHLAYPCGTYSVLWEMGNIGLTSTSPLPLPFLPLPSDSHLQGPGGGGAGSLQAIAEISRGKPVEGKGL